MIYKGEKQNAISFPLGGIGSGCIGISGKGQLIDWEIFNKPAKNTLNGYSHFAIKVKEGDKVNTKVLHGDTIEPYMGKHYQGEHIGYGYGPHEATMAGFPHFKKVVFEGTFPIARLTFYDKNFPVKAKLLAFNPFIPQDSFNSSLPVAMFEWEIENLSKKELEIGLCFSLQNPATVSKNENVQKDGYKGVFLKEGAKNDNEVGYSDLCVLTEEKGFDVSTQRYWYRGAWKDPIITFWKNFNEQDRLIDRVYEEDGAKSNGSVASYVKIEGKEKRIFRFVLAWNTPVCDNYWNPVEDFENIQKTWKNYYATQFNNSFDSALYAMKRFDTLKEKTVTFSDLLQNSSMPKLVKDAVSANLAVLKSPTVLRYEDGSMWAWEGVSEAKGSCEGSCQHVWNYVYSTALLFPDLERSLRDCVQKYGQYEDGGTDMRVPLPRGRIYTRQRSCVDGQMGEVIKCFREWKISGSDEWIKSHAESIFKMIEYAWSESNGDKWDLDCDGIMEGRQHNTLDVELFGPSSWLEGFYLLALDCGAKIAQFVGDNERADKYRKLYENGKKWTNENLFNGKYFYHKVDVNDYDTILKYKADECWNDEVKQIKYQVADGCLIDQVLVDFHSALIGENAIFDKEKKVVALKNLFKYNYKKSMRDLVNTWRAFSLEDESGTIMCSYPEGASVPAIPISYCEETMTGFEYALACELIDSGLVKEGNKVAGAVRKRFDGKKRNPWNEFECGSNYARSMASFALLLVYSGFKYDLRRNYLGFFPVKKTGSYFWSVSNSWGKVRISNRKIIFKVFGDSIELSSFGLSNANRVKAVIVDGNKIDFESKLNEVTFEKTKINRELVLNLC